MKRFTPIPVAPGDTFAAIRDRANSVLVFLDLKPGEDQDPHEALCRADKIATALNDLFNE